MKRFKLTIEYEGTPFKGWQRQPDFMSVQQVIEDAAFGVEGEPVTVFGAGRTDAGVHALGQVAHIDMRKDISAIKLRDALNYHIRPHPVAVLLAEEASPEFHARFSATQRHYIYRLVDRRAGLTFDRQKAWRVIQPIDETAMHEGAQHLLGTHDFSTFRDARCEADSPIKSINYIRVDRDGQEVRVQVGARSFLHRQVRSIVGSLFEVGRGRKTPDWIREILTAADRKACGQVAPPDGLYLARVNYDEDLSNAPADQIALGSIQLK